MTRRQRLAAQAFKWAQQISFEVQNSRNPSDMQRACDAWKTFAKLTDNPYDKEEGRFQTKRYATLMRTNTPEWAFLRGMLNGEAMSRAFGTGLELQGTLDDDAIRDASEALAPVPRAQRAYVGSEIPSAPHASHELIQAYYEGYNKGLRPSED